MPYEDGYFGTQQKWRFISFSIDQKDKRHALEWANAAKNRHLSYFGFGQMTFEYDDEEHVYDACGYIIGPIMGNGLFEGGGIPTSFTITPVPPTPSFAYVIAKLKAKIRLAYQKRH